ncbi:NADPH-Fe(3+) oxidoreductase subunit beta [mine drainage metagenome]|uniref:NADPH-Fe(3+) oxidoreductase subunit beta n=1 Tax=mine drainage metagenome TaxID=410659 RepID=A0A1J5TDH1_9ZZZZ
MASPYAVEIPDLAYFGRQVLCREGCPVRTDSGGYVQAIAEGRYEDAYIIARRPNPFASICGRVCAAPCEAKCRRGALDAAVSIRALKRFVCETFGVESDSFDLGRVYPELKDPRRERVGDGRKVAVIGAGPAGLSCAHELALMGFAPTVFEAQQQSGGMLVLGVPEYRLPRDIVQSEIEAIASLGVEIRHNTRLGRDFTLSDLKQQGFEAVFLGIGAHKSRELAIEGVMLDGVLRAIDFLLNVNLGYNVKLGSKVVVIGGGNVAFDVARSVVRQAERFANMTEAELRTALHQAAGALEQLTARENEAPDEVRLALDVAREAIRNGVPEVHMYCLESLDELPAAREEIEEAEREGIKLHTRYGPRRVIGADGRVTGVELVKCARVFDSNRRFNPQFIEGSEETVPCDTVVLAIGQSADLAWVRPEDDLKITPRGTLQTDPQTMATSRPDIFAGGDVAFGPRIIITAVAEGKKAAKSIARYLTGKVPVEPVQARTTIYDRKAYTMPANYEKLARRSPPALPLERRIGIAEVEKPFPQPDARLQALRCLKCHVSPVFNGDACILCGGCADVCPESCLRLVDVARLRGNEKLSAAFEARYGRVPQPGEHGAIIKDEARCIRCGLCAARCPTGAITMERVEMLTT